MKGKTAMVDLEKVKEFFKKDHYATETTGLEIVEAEYGYAKIKLLLDDRHVNGLGHVMGGVYYTMADFAFAVAANCDFEKPNVVTLSSTIEFLGAAKGRSLLAEAKLEKDGARVSFYRTEIRDESGQLRVVVSTTGCKV